jgi:hypothetical protein
MRSAEGNLPLPDSAPRTAPANYGSRRTAVELLTAAFLLALLTRLGFILLPQVPLEAKAVASIGDSREYIALARNLANSRTFTRDTAPPFHPELFRTPAYPLFLAVPYLLSHSSSLPLHPSSFIPLGLLFQLLLALLTVWLAWKLGLELGLTPKSAGLAALFVALSPNLAFLSSKLISEALFAPLLLVCLLLLNRYRLTGRTRDLIGAGVCSGLLVLTRPIATFFPLLLALYVLVRVHRSSSIVLRSSFRLHPSSFIPPLVLLASVSIVVAPWVIRNGQKTGRYIISTASEHNIYLYDAATVLASEKSITIPQARDSMMAEAQAEFGPIDTTDEAAMWQKLSTVARRHFFQNPARAAPVWLFGVFADFLNPISVGPLLIHSGSSPAPGSANLLQSSLALLVRGRVKDAFTTAWRVRVGGAPTFILVVLACAALFNLILIWFGLTSLFLRRTRGLLWLLLPILYFTFVTGTVGDARFRAPIEPLLCLFAAVALIRPPRITAARSYAPPSGGTSVRDDGSCSIGLAKPKATHRA